MVIADHYRFSFDSLACAAAQPNRLLTTSAAVGWTSLLVDLLEGQGRSDTFETSSTPDLTLVVAMNGRHHVEVFSDTRWRPAVYQPGAAGLTPPNERTRLRWREFDAGEKFRTAHLYLPHTLIEDAAEHYRRVGQPRDNGPESTLVFSDAATSHVVRSLLKAMQIGAPDLYAEQVGRWLAVHLLWRHRAGSNASEDRRNPGLITDRRLARVLEFMSSRLDAPLTARELAKKAGISVHHFTRCFRQQIGSTPLAMLTSMRMDYAWRLLGTTDLPVSQIARLCGYTRPAAFAVAFSRQFKASPTHLRSSRGRP